MSKIILILLIALVFEAIGVVFLSAGLKRIGEVRQFRVAQVAQLVGRGATDRYILTGIFFEAVFFAGLLYLLSQRDVSVVWPLTSLGFVVTALAAKFVLHEHIAPVRWAGICLIMAGAALITYSERQKPSPPTSGALTEAALPK